VSRGLSRTQSDLSTFAYAVLPATYGNSARTQVPRSHAPTEMELILEKAEGSAECRLGCDASEGGQRVRSSAVTLIWETSAFPRPGPAASGSRPGAEWNSGKPRPQNFRPRRPWCSTSTCRRMVADTSRDGAWALISSRWGTCQPKAPKPQTNSGTP